MALSNALGYAAPNILNLSSRLPVGLFSTPEGSFQLPMLEADVRPLPKYQGAGNAENCHQEESVGPFEFLHLASPQESLVY